MNSFHNNEQEKIKAVNLAKHHADADMLVKGTFGHANGSFKGCSVGCFAYDILTEQGKSKDYIDGVLEKCPHSILAEHFNTPEWLERLRDLFFENLKDNTGWHVRLTEAIPVGLSENDFNKIKAKFLIFILKGNVERVEKLDISEDLKKKVIDAINQCLSLHEQAAISGEIDESAAWSAAWSAAESARSAAESAGYETYANYLIELLENK